MITVKPYQEEWLKRFQEEKIALDRAFSNLPIAFHHIGSTAIVGAQAKPIVDILGITSDVTLIDGYNHALEKIGYTALGEYGMKQRRYFHKEGIHLHIFEDTDPEVCRHLRFISYVSAHPEAIEYYSELKAKLADQYPHDIESYILGKEKWIKQIDSAAAKEGIIPHAYPLLGPRKSKWTLEQIVDALHVNMHLQMTYFSKYHPNIHLVFQPDVTVVVSDIQDDMFNYTLSTRFTEENVQSRVEHVLSFYREKNLPVSWWVSQNQDTPASLASVLEEKGLSHQENDVGMYLELYDYQPGQREHLFHRVEFLDKLRDFTEIIVSVGGHVEMYEKVYQELPPILYQEGAPLEMYVMYQDGVPVTTGMAVFHANVMGIYYVTTKPDYQRKGLGSAMMHYLLARAKAKGYLIATLQASEQGKSLYERLGFSECCRFAEYK